MKNDTCQVGYRDVNKLAILNSSQSIVELSMKCMVSLPFRSDSVSLASFFTEIPKLDVHTKLRWRPHNTQCAPTRERLGFAALRYWTIFHAVFNLVLQYCGIRQICGVRFSAFWSKIVSKKLIHHVFPIIF